MIRPVGTGCAFKSVLLPLLSALAIAAPALGCSSEADEALPADAPAAVSAVQPVKPPTPASCGGPARGNTRFQAVHFNVLGSTFGGDWASRRAVVIERMKRVVDDDSVALASIYGLTEVTRGEAEWLAANLAPGYAVAVHSRLQAIVYDTATWTVEDTGRYPFTFGGTAYHGFVNARLKSKRTDEQVNVLETHLVPNAVDDAANKRARQLNQIQETVASWRNPVVLLGDLNWNAPALETAAGSGFCSARVHAAAFSPSEAQSYRTSGGANGTYGTGGSILDYGLVRGGITMHEYRVLRGNYDGTKPGSDHHMLAFDLQR